MNQKTAEFLLLLPVAVTTGWIIFLATGVQQLFDRMNAREFKFFLTHLVNYAMTSWPLLALSTITFIAMIPYWIYFGFSNIWFNAGLFMWILTSTAAKQTTLPIYSSVTGRKFPGYKAMPELGPEQEVELKKAQTALAKARKIHLVLCLVSTLLMAAGYLAEG